MRSTNFGWALDQLKSGFFVTRRGWNGRNMCLFLKRPLDTDVGAPTLPYIMMKTAQGELVPWLASQTDVLSDDWDSLGGEQFAPDFNS